MKRIVLAIVALFSAYSSHSMAMTLKERQAIENLIIASTLAVSICNEKELPNLDYRGSVKVLLLTAMAYENIATNINPMRVKTVENRIRSMPVEEKYKFCMKLFKTAPGLFEDRETGKILGGEK